MRVQKSSWSRFDGWKTTPLCLRGRLQLEQGPVVLVRQYIDETIRPLTHVSDPLTPVGKEDFAADLLPVLVENNPVHLTGTGNAADLQAADEEVVSPCGKARPGVEGDTGYRDGRSPYEDGIFKTLLRRLARNPGATVLAAVTDEGPSVVGADFQDVHLISAQGAIFRFPDFAGRRMNRHAEHVAMSVGKDLRHASRTLHKRVCRGNTAVIGEAKNLAGVTSEILRDLVVRPSDGHVEKTIPSKRHAIAGCRAGADTIGDKKLLHIDEAHAVQTASHQRGRAASGCRLRVAQVHPSRFSKPWMEGDIHQTAKSFGVDRWGPRDRRRIEHTIAHDAETAGPLRHQHVTVRQKRQAPRVR